MALIVDEPAVAITAAVLTAALPAPLSALA
jgi:hypothetical protein